MTRTAPDLPPEPFGPRALNVARFMLQPGRFLERVAARHGEYVTLRLSASRTIVVSSDPEAVKVAFTGDPDKLRAGAGNVVLRPLLGSRSVLLLDGPEHLRQRRLMLPAFHGERMRRYGSMMAEVAERHLAGWPQGSGFPAHPTMQAITLEVILRAVFGARAEGEIERLGRPVKRLLDALANRPLLLALQVTSSEAPRRLSPWGWVNGLIAAADAVIFEQIGARRADPGRAQREDVLSMLLGARDEEGAPLSDAELRDELLTLLVAGHETTATALSWTLERLVRHPAALERLLAEQRGAAAEELGGGEYLEAVITESLRLRPVVPGIARYLTEPVRIGSRTLPAGVHLSPSIYLLHRRPDLYPDPTAFRPERFLGRRPGTYEWIPFGGGIRRCLGASFALYEMRIVLATIMRRMWLARATGPGERISRRAITFAPASGGRIAVGGRDG